MTDTPELTYEEFYRRFSVVIIKDDQYETWMRGLQELTGGSMVAGTLSYLNDNWHRLTPEQHAQIFALATLVFRNT